MLPFSLRAWRFSQVRDLMGIVKFCCGSWRMERPARPRAHSSRLYTQIIMGTVMLGSAWRLYSEFHAGATAAPPRPSLAGGAGAGRGRGPPRRPPRQAVRRDAALPGAAPPARAPRRRAAGGLVIRRRRPHVGAQLAPYLPARACPRLSPAPCERESSLLCPAEELRRRCAAPDRGGVAWSARSHVSH